MAPVPCSVSSELARCAALARIALFSIVALIPSVALADGGTIIGFAFVDSSVMSMGSQAKLPAGTTRCCRHTLPCLIVPVARLRLHSTI
jgi:hypothetical protein